MAVSILHDADTGRGCLWCTATECAFGPVFEDVPDARQLEQFVEWMTSAGIDPREEHGETLRALYPQFLAECAVETRLAFRCDHCEQVLAAHEVHSVQTGVVDGNIAYETPCPRCGCGDGDFTEVAICVGCGEPCPDRAAHVGCAERAANVIRERKPPADSVRTRPRRLKEA